MILFKKTTRCGRTHEAHPIVQFDNFLLEGFHEIARNAILTEPVRTFCAEHHLPAVPTPTAIDLIAFVVNRKLARIVRRVHTVTLRRGCVFILFFSRFPQAQMLIACGTVKSSSHQFPYVNAQSLMHCLVVLMFCNDCD